MKLKGLGALNQVWEAPDNLPSPARSRIRFVDGAGARALAATYAGKISPSTSPSSIHSRSHRGERGLRFQVGLPGLKSSSPPSSSLNGHVRVAEHDHPRAGKAASASGPAARGRTPES